MMKTDKEDKSMSETITTTSATVTEAKKAKAQQLRKTRRVLCQEG